MPAVLSNWFIRTLVNSPLHPLLGDSFAVITVHGRKTGQAYSTPINVSREGDTFTIVSLRNRTWWRNLRGSADAELRVGGKQIAVRGEVLEQSEQVLAGLAAYFHRYPHYAKYFKIQLGADGQVRRDDLVRVANERVLIRLCK
ncbi:MAG: nitroreductase family deazaflavin-dependent oxidoreductase [Chloroflexi bacterium]|nr:nitroreductase family deazaflavin-dependent oxidoreductase [Chloroflexota bacterium]